MNVLLISLDCVRHEALSCYSENFDYLSTIPYRAKTPTIDSIAREGLVFTNAFTQAPFTPASHASVFTGTNPYNHGIRSMFGCELNEEVSTLAEHFQNAGYETGGFIGAHALSSKYGVDRGFETYDEEFEDSRKNWIVGNRRPAGEVTDEAIKWLNNVDDDFFLFVHYFDAHDGGQQNAETSSETVSSNVDHEDDHTPIYVQLYNQYLRQIDSLTGGLGRQIFLSWDDLRDDAPSGRRYHLKQVQRIDKQINRIKRTLASLNQYEDTLIILFADHGDAFGEHGEFGHREYLYDTTLNVPLIIKPPNGEATETGTHGTLTRLIDIFPTVTSIAGIEETQSTGENLIEYVTDDDDNLAAYGETRCESSPQALKNPKTDFTSLRSSEWKLIINNLNGNKELYHVASDPAEMDDMSDGRSDMLREMRGQLESLTSDHAKEKDIDMSQTIPSVVDQLEGLGYL
ncbi:sulfatase [Halosimplex pelagicum]|nr:sulfatase [Halosimplex pelagicum]